MLHLSVCLLWCCRSSVSAVASKTSAPQQDKLQPPLPPPLPPLLPIPPGWRLVFEPLSAGPGSVTAGDTVVVSLSVIPPSASRGSSGDVETPATCANEVHTVAHVCLAMAGTGHRIGCFDADEATPESLYIRTSLEFDHAGQHTLVAQAWARSRWPGGEGGDGGGAGGGGGIPTAVTELSFTVSPSVSTPASNVSDPQDVARPFGGLIFRQPSSWDRDRDALLQWGKVRVAESVQLSLGPRGPLFTMRRGVEPGEILLESDPSSIVALDDGSAVAREFAPWCRSGGAETASGNDGNASGPDESVHALILAAAGRLCAEFGEAHGINCERVTRTINLWRLLVDASQEEQGRRRSGRGGGGVLSKDKRPFLHLILHTNLEPYVWRASGVDWLQGSEWAAGLQQALAQRRGGMNWACDFLLPKLWEMFPRDTDFPQEAYTCQGYCWTETLYTSRSMNDWAMVPLHINCDHDPANANAGFVADPSGGYRATAERRIQRGEALLLVYGHHSNWKLQARYDFVLARGSNAARNRVRLEPCQLGRALGTSRRCANGGLLALMPEELTRRSPMSSEQGVTLAPHLDQVVDPETLMILTLFSATDEAFAEVVQATERRGWRIAEGTRLSALPACVCALKRWAAWMLADTNRWLKGLAPVKVPPTRRRALRQLAEETAEILGNVLGLVAAEQYQCGEEGG